jgi:hypothetical protein
MNPFSNIPGAGENEEAGTVMSDTIEAGGASTSDCYFTENGQRRSPVTTASLLELLRAQKISGDPAPFAVTAWSVVKSSATR